LRHYFRHRSHVDLQGVDVISGKPGLARQPFDKELHIDHRVRRLQATPFLRVDQRQRVLVGALAALCGEQVIPRVLGDVAIGQ